MIENNNNSKNKTKVKMHLSEIGIERTRKSVFGILALFRMRTQNGSFILLFGFAILQTVVY